MKIDKIHIDGFGIFHDHSIQNFKKGINVIYGNNEAGKSTLLDFIRFTLFEYPRSHAERRKPLLGGTHSGRIWLNNSLRESLSVYRHGNAKDFLLEYKGEKFEDEKLYHKLIGNASIDLFKNIYAITIDELTSVEQLGESGMEDRIFSMGMGLSGVDFGGFEKNLIDHSSAYFKARGSVQVLPKLSNDIVEKEEAINKLRNKLGEYNRLSEQKEKLETDLTLLNEKRSKLGKDKNEYSDLSKAYPEYIKYKSAQTQISEIGRIQIYSSKVLEEYESLKFKLNAEREELEKIQQQLTQIEKDLNELKWNSDLSKKANLLDYLKTNVKLYEDAKAKRSQENEKLFNAHSQIETILKRLGVNLSKTNLLELKGTFELQTKAIQIGEGQLKLDRLIDTKKASKERISDELSALEIRHESLIPETKNLIIQSDEQRTKANHRRIELDTAFKSALENRSLPYKTTSKFPLILSIVFLLVGIGLIFIDFISGGIVIGIALIGLIAVLFQNRDTSFSGIPNQNLNDINRELDVINTSIQEFDQWKEAKEEVNNQLKFKSNEFQKIEIELNRLTNQFSALESEWQSLLENNQLPSSIVPSRINDFISNVEEIKRQNSNEIEARKSIQNIDYLITSFEDKLNEVAPENSALDTSFVYTIISKMEENELINSKRERFLNEISSFSIKKDLKQENVKKLNEEIDAIFKSLNVENESALYYHFKLQNSLQEEKEKLENSAATIQTLCGENLLKETILKLSRFSPSELNTKKEETSVDYELAKTKYDELNKDLAGIEADIRHILEVDEMYGLQNEKESLQAQLKEETKEWLTTRLALEVLNQSKQKYEKERQPEVITQTRDYFRSITNNAYEDIRISLSEKHVSIIDAAGNSKTVQELSRGTREQLLLALRLGLIAEYEKNAEPLPVAFDDIMVNFDTVRTENLAKILIDFAADRQVLYFTCHAHTRDIFEGLGANVVEWEK
ncbi:AAA family ATPase [Brumimicrobium mesophilum]|uniref:AAA family ATPase n=1 Tax=Brumimicrobium mesophilum TaxID=392717 RepID=UPI000D142A04|nr:AAA family ATPase [Brumimicrobium mesophilum]